MTKTQRRHKAAKKAARTRAANAAMLKRWREVDEPANRRIEGLFNFLLRSIRPNTIKLRYVGEHRLKQGAAYGVLRSVKHGGKIWSVRPDNYRRPQDFHPINWEVLLP